MLRGISSIYLVTWVCRFSVMSVN